MKKGWDLKRENVTLWAVLIGVVTVRLAQTGVVINSREGVYPSTLIQNDHQALKGHQSFCSCSRHPCRSADSSPCRVSRGLSPRSNCALPGAPYKRPCSFRNRAFRIPFRKTVGVRRTRPLRVLHERRDQRSVNLSDRTVAGCVKEEQQTCKT